MTHPEQPSKLDQWVLRGFDKCPCASDHLFRHHPIRWSILWLVGQLGGWGLTPQNMLDAAGVGKRRS